MQKEGTLAKQLSALLLCGWLVSGCGGGSTPTPGDEATSLQTDGTSVSIDGQNQPDTTSQTTGDNQSYVSSVTTKGPAEDVVASQEALFIAEGDHGVEIIKIGYKDRIDHELIATISGINATYVTLSEDQTKLYIQNKEGYINIYNIEDIYHPIRERIVTRESLQSNPVTKNGLYEFAPKQQEGLIVYDVSNPSNKTLVSRYTTSPVYSLVLVDQDTKALVATKTNGIDLLDITDPYHIEKKGNHPMAGNTLGLSVNEGSGLLFIANGDNGVKVYNLNIFIDTML